MERAYKCAVCGVLFPVEKLVYHTDPNEKPLYLFCGVECSFKHHQEKIDANKNNQESNNNQ